MSSLAAEPSEAFFRSDGLLLSLSTLSTSGAFSSGLGLESVDLWANASVERSSEF